MTIRIRVWSACEVSVHTSPSWWERLIGRGESDARAIGVPGLGGATSWCFDHTSRRIDDERVVAAIERATSAAT